MWSVFFMPYGPTIEEWHLRLASHLRATRLAGCHCRLRNAILQGADGPRIMTVVALDSESWRTS
jgi:hypothetical protein